MSMSRKLVAPILMLELILVALSSTSTPVLAAEVYPREQCVIIHKTGGREGNPFQYNPYLIGWPLRGGMNQIGMEKMFYYFPNNGTVIGWLATGMDVSSDFKTVTIHVRPGVKWNDGQPFTARDVAFTYNMLLQPHTPPLSMETYVQGWIESVEVVDDLTVKFTLKKPHRRVKFDSLFVDSGWSSLAIVPEHIWKDVDPTKFSNPDFVFTGPYKPIETSPNGDRFVWERRDDYWATEVFGIRPAAKYWIFVWYATLEAQLLKFINNEIDKAGFLDVDSFLSARDKNPYIRDFILLPPYGNLDPAPYVFTLNCAKYPWNIKEVRRALSYAIDRDKLNDISWGGIAPPYPGILAHWNEPRWLELMEVKGAEYDVLAYDPAKTAQIFTNLGWTKGADGIWVTNNGTRLTFEMLVFGDFGDNLKWEGEQLVDILREVGIDAYAKILSGSARADAYSRGQWDGAADWQSATNSVEPFGVIERFHSKYWRPIGELAGMTYSCPRYRNSTLDSIIEQMEAMSPDNPEYVNLVSQALDILNTELPVIPLLKDIFLVPFSTKYWTNYPTAENYYAWGYFQAASHAGTFTALNIMPTEIAHNIVYFIKDTREFRPEGTFRGTDLKWYGPFTEGDAVILPTDDAEFWVRQGYASFTPPPAKAPTELMQAVTQINSTVTAVAGQVQSLTAEVRGLTGQVTTITMVAAVEAVALIVAVVGIVVVMRKKP